MEAKSPPVTGRKVLFIGGPEAGNVRLVPDSHGDILKSDNDYVYKVWPMSMPGDRTKIFFAYAANEHPIKMLIDMWREYSPAAQIKRDHLKDGHALTYNNLKDHVKS